MQIGADVHLGNTRDAIRLKDGAYSRTHDVRTRLGELLEVARSTRQSIVIAGDVFHTVDPSSDVIEVFNSWLADTNEAGVSVYLTPGNHDAGVLRQNLGMVKALHLPNVEVVTEVCTKTIDGVGVLFAPHLPKLELDKVEEEFGSYSSYLAHVHSQTGGEMIVGHGMPRNMDYSNDVFFEAADAMEFNFEELPPVKCVVLGHIHDQKIMWESKSHGAVYVSPGSFAVNNFGEVDEEKGYATVVDPASPEVHPWERDVTEYIHLTLDLATKDEVDLSEDNLRPVVEGAIVKVTVNARDSIQVDEPWIRSQINKWGRVVRFEKKVQSRPDNDSHLVPDEEEESPVFENIDHKKVFRNWMEGVSTRSQKVRDRALEIGEEIIDEVMSE